MRAVVLSDIHSGDAYGLCNPAQIPKGKKQAKEVAKKLFDWYVAKVGEIGRVDAIILPGELIEGSGDKDTIDLWTTDPEEQADACADLLCMWDCNVFFACYSSAYHDGRTTNTDHMLIRELKARGKQADIKTVQRLIFDEVKVNVMHYVGGSSTPYGFASQLMKAGVTDVVRGAGRGYAFADLYLRGHTHTPGHAGNRMLTVINCPTLKWPLGRFGRKIDRPWYGMGLTDLEFEGRDWDWHSHDFEYVLPEEKYARVTEV